MFGFILSCSLTFCLVCVCCLSIRESACHEGTSRQKWCYSENSDELKEKEQGMLDSCEENF